MLKSQLKVSVVLYTRDASQYNMGDKFNTCFLYLANYFPHTLQPELVKRVEKDLLKIMAGGTADILALDQCSFRRVILYIYFLIFCRGKIKLLAQKTSYNEAIDKAYTVCLRQAIKPSVLCYCMHHKILH